jgi:hypothetical protein
MPKSSTVERVRLIQPTRLLRRSFHIRAIEFLMELADQKGTPCFPALPYSGAI